MNGTVGIPRRDLGRIDGTLLVFGGPYSNLEATRALRARAAELGIPAGRTLCTGDVVAYCADPAATVAEIRDWGVAVVMGNCEESLAAEAEDCGCGFEAGTACDLLSREWYPFSLARTGAEERAWMAALPRRIDLEIGGVRFAAVHGTMSSISRYLFASSPGADLARELDLAGADGILAGHCGLPFTRTVGGRLWHNAGAIGMPANDGTAEVWYALVEPGEGGGLRLGHHRLAYDHGAAARRMRAEGLAEGYARALESGLWPSLDVLPPEEREATGRRLAEESVLWRAGASANLSGGP